MFRPLVFGAVLTATLLLFNPFTPVLERSLRTRRKKQIEEMSKGHRGQ
jgi:hypothetical protein